MAFVGKPFIHDIFVSYSHGDVQGDGLALLKQWSQGFVAELERELQAFPEIGAELRIFLDQSHRPGQNLDPMAPLTETLQREIAGAAILAILMTPQYLRSKWCRQELEWWVKSQQDRAFAHEDRIAVARCWTTSDEPWPTELCDRHSEPYVGHLFFDRSRADVRPQPHSWPKVSSDTLGPFRESLLDFVGSLQLRLRQLRKELAQKQAQESGRQRLSMAAGHVVYLHGRSTHSPIWEEAHKQLEDDGYTVFPLEPENVDSDPRRIRESQSERVRTMSGCDAVLLLGTADSAALAADLMVIGRLDRHQAVAQSSRPLPCGVLDTVGIGKSKPDWSRKAKSLGVDWFDASAVPWTPQIKTWLNGAAA